MCVRTRRRRRACVPRDTHSTLSRAPLEPLPAATRYSVKLWRVENFTPQAKILAAKKKLAEAEASRASSPASAGAGAPPRKKTLKELEEANARSFSTPPPTASLYGVGTATR